MNTSDITKLATERRNPRSRDIDRLTTAEMVSLINSEDKKVADAVEKVCPQIAAAIDLIYARMKRGGRLIYCGCGTSGRLGILDASECPPTYSVSPETVQAAIATLHRPETYSRSVTVEYLWSGGSSSTEMSVFVSGGWTRTDRTMADGQVRHTFTNGEGTYIWYNSESDVFSGPAGTISPDMEQAIPTYEDVLALQPERIAQADYRMVSDVRCIYVETAEDDWGYTQRYWVSVDTGLLVVAERLQEGETVYRMASLTADQSVPDAQQGEDVQMLHGLGHDALVRSDDQQGQVDAPGPGQHVFDEFFVAGHVHDACLGAVRPVQVGKAQVDGDAPALFLRQTVGVDAGKGLDKHGFAVVYVSGGADDDVLHGRSS